MKIKIKWKRETKSTGKWSSFENNADRGWYANIGKDKNIGALFNPARSHLSNASPCWQMMFMTDHGANMVMKRTFPVEQLEEAKQYLEQLYFKIINAKEGEEPYYGFKQRIRKYDEWAKI
jgi:hypothetical protein